MTAPNELRFEKWVYDNVGEFNAITADTLFKCWQDAQQTERYILPTDLTDSRIRDQVIPKRLINFDVNEMGEAPRGIYLRLFHGRTDPNEQMDDFGPTCDDDIGPFDWAHFTYMNPPSFGHTQSNALHLWDNFSPDACFLMPPNSLCRHDDMLFWNGIFYGDWELIWR